MPSAPLGPTVTVLAHARVPSPSADIARERGIPRGLVAAATLRDALTREWPTDAHVTAYEPLEIPVTNGAPGETMPVRHTREAVAEGHAARLTMLIGDVDGPGHVATPEWRADVESRLNASGLAWYSTRNGYRVLEQLPSAYIVATKADERLWWEFYLGWRAYLLDAHGLEIDERCKDWTRIYRLPNVVREGKPARSVVRRLEAMPMFDADHWISPKSEGTPAHADTPARHDDRAMRALERAVAIAERMPASIEGQGGDEALFQCARELATQLGEDARAIEFVLADVFNARCLPPWPAAKLAREAVRAADTQATPEARFGRRQEERIEAKRAESAYHAAQPEPQASPWDSPMSFLAPMPPINYLCEGLRLAPSKGKISVVAGNAGGGKGPIADHLAIAFALGEKAFGEHPCVQSNVLLLDCEGIYLTMRRLHRLAAGMGHEARELDGRLFAIDASTLLDLTSEENQRQLERVVRDRGIGVVVLDSYTTAMIPTGIDSNSPQYAILAQLMGRLGVLVIVVAHANKASAKNGQPQLSDIAYSGAFGALAQTAIVVHYPDESDKDVISVGCARAPETGFTSFLVRFEGAQDAPVLSVRVHTPAEPVAPPSADLKRFKRNLERASTDADRVVEYLRVTDDVGHGLDPRAVKVGVGLSTGQWGEARAELRRRGIIVERSLPGARGTSVALREIVEARAREGGVLPTVGAVASVHTAKGQRR